ncbi:MAG: hypothetical protein Q4G26_08190, partial [Paracoccus sp. (in: a-proteobacteria)]|nr:hypothetical protein [Paracoccus sp. (in: a-proteobacteria)]
RARKICSSRVGSRLILKQTETFRALSTRPREDFATWLDEAVCARQLAIKHRYRREKHGWLEENSAGGR